MPLAQRTVVFFGMLLFSIPVQYLFSEYFKSDDPHKLLEKIRCSYNKSEEIFFSIITFRARFEQEILLFLRDWGDDNEQKKNQEQNDPMPEAVKLQSKTANQLGHNRPDSVLFRVGDMVACRSEGYRGVIIAWHIDPNRENEAHYTILLEDKNMANKKSDIVSGVPGRELFRLQDPIVNKFLYLYFHGFDGSRFIPQPWLKERFPKD